MPSVGGAFPILTYASHSDAFASVTSTVDFGARLVGANSDVTLTVRNIGGANLTGLGITLDGATPGDFSVVASPAAPVAPGGTTVFTVRFTPGATGLRSAVLHLASNDGDENPFDIALTGTGTLREAELALLALTTFRPTRAVPGSHPTNFSFTLSNNGPWFLSNSRVQFRFHLSTNAVFGDGDDLLIGAYNISLSTPVGGTTFVGVFSAVPSNGATNMGLSTITIPPNLSGWFHVFAEAVFPTNTTYSDSVLSNNVAMLAQSIEVLSGDQLTTSLNRANLRNGQVELTVSGVPGVLYRIQSSTNLTNWSNVTTVFTGPDGTAAFSESLTGSHRFYRAVLLP